MSKLNAATLGRVESFASLPIDVLSAVASVTESSRYESGALIVRHLDSSRDLYLILAGEVRVSLVAKTGRVLTYQILHPGEIFGEVAAVDGLPRTATVAAESDAVLGRITHADFHQLLTAHHEFALVILHRLARLNRRLAERVFEYHSYDVRGRVYAEILREMSPAPDCQYTITDRDMASRVGTTRENVTRINSDLRKRGIVTRRGTISRVTDPAALNALLEDSEFG